MAHAARSSLSPPRATILSASSGNGLCSALASSHVSEKILNLEDAQTEIADQKLRKETAAAIAEISKTVVEAGAVFDIATVKLIAATQRAADFVLDAHGLTAYLMNAKAEVPAATALIAQILKDRAAQTIAGTAKAHLVMPEQIAPRQTFVPPVPTTQRLFLTQHLAWYDSDGDKHRAPSMHDGELPLHLTRLQRGRLRRARSQERRASQKSQQQNIGTARLESRQVAQ